MERAAIWSRVLISFARRCGSQLSRVSTAARVCLLLVAASCSNPAGAANGYFLHGYSASQRAMAGAGTALAAEAAQLPVNPAGLIGVSEQWTLDLNVMVAHNDVDITARPAGAGPGLLSIEPDQHRSAAQYFFCRLRPTPPRSTPTPPGGVSFNGGGLQSLFRSGRARLAEGIPGLDTRCEGLFAGGPRVAGELDVAGLCGNGDAVSSADLVLVYLRGGYARRFGDRLSLGISPMLALESFKSRGLSAFDDYSVAPGQVTDQGHAKRPSLGFGGRVGVLWSPVDHATLGASWQSRIRIGRFDSYAGLILDGGRIDSPEMWNIGLALQPARAHLLALDFERINFSDLPVVGRRFDAAVFAEQCLLPRLLLGTEPSQTCLGGEQGPGFGWTDTLSYKLGYRYTPSAALAFGVGYTRARRPTHGDQALLAILAPGVTEDHFAAGLSWRLRPGLSFNMAALYSPRSRIKGRNPLSHIDASALASSLSEAPRDRLFGPDPLDQTITVSSQVLELIFGVQFGL